MAPGAPDDVLSPDLKPGLEPGLELALHLFCPRFDACRIHIGRPHQATQRCVQSLCGATCLFVTDARAAHLSVFPDLEADATTATQAYGRPHCVQIHLWHALARRGRPFDFVVTQGEAAHPDTTLAVCMPPDVLEHYALLADSAGDMRLEGAPYRCDRFVLSAPEIVRVRVGGRDAATDAVQPSRSGAQLHWTRSWPALRGPDVVVDCTRLHVFSSPHPDVNRYAAAPMPARTGTGAGAPLCALHSPCFHSHQTASSAHACIHDVETLAAGVHWIVPRHMAPRRCRYTGSFEAAAPAGSAAHDGRQCDERVDCSLSSCPHVSEAVRRCCRDAGAGVHGPPEVEHRGEAVRVRLHVVHLQCACRAAYCSQARHGAAGGDVALLVDACDPPQVGEALRYVRGHMREIVNHAARTARDAAQRPDTADQWTEVYRSIAFAPFASAASLPWSPPHQQRPPGSMPERPLHVAVINVPRRTDRARQSARLWIDGGDARALPFRAVKFNAVTPGDAQRLAAVAKRARTTKPTISDAELACYASHARLWERAERTPDDQWMLVCEDDARTCLSCVCLRNALSHCVRVGAAVNAGWISLSTDGNSGWQWSTSDACGRNGRGILYAGTRWLTTAYLVRARGARLLLRLCRPGHLGVDAEMMLASQACLEHCLLSTGADRRPELQPCGGWTACPHILQRHGRGLFVQDVRDSDLSAHRTTVNQARVERTMRSRKQQMRTVLLQPEPIGT